MLMLYLSIVVAMVYSVITYIGFCLLLYWLCKALKIEANHLFVLFTSILCTYSLSCIIYIVLKALKFIA